MTFSLSVIWLLPLLAVVRCDAHGPSFIRSETDYITYMTGDMDVILTVPHGGSLTPDHIPDRTYGCKINGKCVYTHHCGTTSTSCKATTVKDSYTVEMALMIADEIEAQTGNKPHVVINNLHRRKLDMNRPIDQATFGVPEMEHEYNRYTSFIQAAKASFSGPGLLFDIHGVSSHSEEWVEIGYRISKTQLNSGAFGTSDASIRALGGRKCGSDSDCFEQLVRGRTSFGKMLSDSGYDVIPSPSNPSPGENGGYYRGGYTVDEHGSIARGNVDAIQIESPAKYRNPTGTPAYARNLARAMLRYYQANY